MYMYFLIEKVDWHVALMTQCIKLFLFRKAFGMEIVFFCMVKKKKNTVDSRYKNTDIIKSRYNPSNFLAPKVQNFFVFLLFLQT